MTMNGILDEAQAMHLVEPKTRAWTAQEYHQMDELGWFEGQRVQLVDGEIIIMSPQNFSHSVAVDRISKLLDRAVGEQYWVRSQLPLVLSGNSEPEPDISVVSGKREDYTDHPTTAILVIEVSDSTLSFDRGQKCRDYARAGIAHYWIVNLTNRSIEVYSRSVAGTPSDDWTYDGPSIIHAGEPIAFPAPPHLRFDAGELLP